MSSDQTPEPKKNPTRQHVTLVEAKEAGATIGIDWPSARFDVGEFRDGIMHEMEHSDVTGGDLEATARIAYAHLKTCPDYYVRLDEVEKGCKLEVIGPEAPEEKINPVEEFKLQSALQYFKDAYARGETDPSIRIVPDMGRDGYFIFDAIYPDGKYGKTHLLSDPAMKGRGAADTTKNRAKEKARKWWDKKQEGAKKNPTGPSLVAYRERASTDPHSGEQGILRHEWSVWLVKDFNPDTLSAAWGPDWRRSATHVLVHRYIRRGVEEPWTPFQSANDFSHALEYVDDDAVAVHPELKKLQAKRLAYRQEQEAKKRQEIERRQAAEQKGRSEAAFMKMAAKDPGLAGQWNAFMAEHNSPAEQHAFLDDPEFMRLYKDVFDAETIPTKKRSIKAFLAYVGKAKKNPSSPHNPAVRSILATVPNLKPEEQGLAAHLVEWHIQSGESFDRSKLEKSLANGIDADDMATAKRRAASAFDALEQAGVIVKYGATGLWKAQNPACACALKKNPSHLSGKVKASRPPTKAEQDKVVSALSSYMAAKGADVRTQQRFYDKYMAALSHLEGKYPDIDFRSPEVISSLERAAKKRLESKVFVGPGSSF